jgi:hypothetical protein
MIISPKKQIIIALSGRKNAGKNTAAIGIRKYFDNDAEFFECSFADDLKEFCINVLGLKLEQCYGSDEEKNSPTKYLWENAPEYLRWIFSDNEKPKQMVKDGCSTDDLVQEFCGLASGDSSGAVGEIKTGPMTGREIMQLLGTNLIRNTFGNVWAESTVRRIKRQGKFISTVVDLRFPNEAEAVLKEPFGYVIRFTRSPFGTKDVHPSESALDGYNWNRDKCIVFDNSKMSVEEQNIAIQPVIEKIIKGVI